MRKTEKIRYEIDPFNRLIFAKTDRESKIPRFRHILDDTFRIDKNDALTYHIKSPSPPSITQQLKLSGKARKFLLLPA